LSAVPDICGAAARTPDAVRETRGAGRGEAGARRLKVFVMDLWCYVPYYDGYLCKSLQNENVDVTVGAISYHRDCGHFARQGLRNDPGLLDIVARLNIRNPHVRRILKFIEFFINSAALAIRFAVAPPDILHVQYIPLIEQGFPFEFWFMEYAKKLGIKLVYTVHNALPLDVSGNLTETYQRVYRLPDALICHNQSTRTRLVEEFGVEPERILLIHHGPMFHDTQGWTKEEARARLGYPPDQCIVLWQGIVMPYKGLDFLLDAWHKVRSRGSNCRLVIAGTGEQRWLRGIEEKIRALGIQDSVDANLRFLTVEEVALHYHAADMVVYPYKEISTSGALMTGISFRKALVATNLPSFAELLRDGENAALVQYGDVEGLAATLERLIQDPAERDRLAAGLGELGALRDPWAPIARETRNCYESLLGFPSSLEDSAEVNGQLRSCD
jgi:glycosyltransferase involved in cell wall biosynthesis